MQQIIATGKSILYSAKFHKVLQIRPIIKFEGEQPNYLPIFLNTNRITKFDEIINLGNVFCQ